VKSHAKADLSAVNFPPEWRIPEDIDEAMSVIALVSDAIDRTGSQRGWQREQQAAHVISLLPEDREAAREIVNKYSKSYGGDE
jgi:hypothetical protein